MVFSVQPGKGIKGNRIIPISAPANYSLGAGSEGLERQRTYGGETVWKCMEYAYMYINTGKRLGKHKSLIAPCHSSRYCCMLGY